ncbi:unnamed protein product [Ectocarpus sp. 13 AM-2016]
MDTMDADALLGMSLDEMLAAKPKKKVDRGGRGGKVRNTGRASRQQQTQPYRQPAPKDHVGGGSNNRVYVGNLAWTVTWKELKDLMSTCGPCKAEVPSGADGRSRLVWPVLLRARHRHSVWIDIAKLRAHRDQSGLCCCGVWYAPVAAPRLPADVCRSLSWSVRMRCAQKKKRRKCQTYSKIEKT